MIPQVTHKKFKTAKGKHRQKLVSLLVVGVLLSISAIQAKELTIRQIVDKYYKGKNLYIGSAGHEASINLLSGKILDKEFSYVTPSNDFKQTIVHPIFNKWFWEKPDHWIKHAKSVNQVIRLHAPISPQCSKWVKEDNRTAEELSKMLDEYVIAVCTRYNNQPGVRWIDVVNETIAVEDKEDPLGNVVAGEWFGARFGTDKWENPWTKIGYDENSDIKVPLYIDRAFELANKYAPNMKYVINEHGAFEEKVWQRMKQLVHYLRDVKHRKVDAIGWQAHIDMGWEKIPGNLQRLSEFADWCHQNNLEFHVTEMNVWLRDGNEGKYKEQADTYEAIFNCLLPKLKTGTIGINFWNVIDKDIPNSTWSGTLWDDNGKPRPAYYRIKEALIKNAKK